MTRTELLALFGKYQGGLVMADEPTAVDEHRVVEMLAFVQSEAEHYRLTTYRRFTGHIKRLHLPADDEANALARLREVLGISE